MMVLCAFGVDFCRSAQCCAAPLLFVDGFVIASRKHSGRDATRRDDEMMMMTSVFEWAVHVFSLMSGTKIVRSLVRSAYVY